MITYALLVIMMLSALAGQLLLKSGVNQSQLEASFQSVVRTLLMPHIILGFTIYGLSSILWLFVLQKLPLSVAYPSLAITYVLIVFLSAVFIREPLTVNKVIGSFIIVTGVFLIFHK